MTSKSIVATLVIVMGGFGVASASDYSHECKSTDGRYVLDDGTLYRTSDTGRQTPLTYAILERQTLEEEEGSCKPSNPEANGASFSSRFEKYRMTLLIDDGARPVRASVFCELAESGLPAAFNCAVSTTTKASRKPGPIQRFVKGSSGTWDHNGSVMRLEASGKERRFYYMYPRDGIRAVGVSGDTLLFEGVREGSRYDGTARVFKKKCGAQTFPVSGQVAEDDQRVVLIGNAPIIDEATCTVTGSKPEQLVFQRTP